MGKNAAELSKKAYENRKKKGLWLNRKQRLLMEHGPMVAKAYEAWTGMKTRCKANPESGNRCYAGISVCKRWIESFENFLSDVGIPSEGLSLDRIDSTKNYEPGNCRWADKITQARNRVNVKISLEDAREIRRLYAEGNMSQQKIADIYGILQVSVSQIARNQIWKLDV